MYLQVPTECVGLEEVEPLLCALAQHNKQLKTLVGYTIQTKPQWMDGVGKALEDNPQERTQSVGRYFITGKRGQDVILGREQGCRLVLLYFVALEDLHPCQRLSIDRRLPKTHGPASRFPAVRSAVRYRAADLTSLHLFFSLPSLLYLHNNILIPHPQPASIVSHFPPLSSFFPPLSHHRHASRGADRSRPLTHRQRRSL